MNDLRVALKLHFANDKNISVYLNNPGNMESIISDYTTRDGAQNDYKKTISIKENHSRQAPVNLFSSKISGSNHLDSLI